MEQKETRAFRGIWIPSEIWLCENLSIQEKLFLVEIDSLDNENGCFASNKYFSEFFNMSKGRVSQIINELENKKWITIEYIYDKKNIEKRIIKILSPPFPKVFNKLNRGYLENDEGVVNILKGGYLENAKDNNTIYNNTINIIKEIIEYMNEIGNTSYKYNASYVKKIVGARLNDGYKKEELLDLVWYMNEIWKKKPIMFSNSKMSDEYYQPSTIFREKTVEEYLQKYRNEKERRKNDRN